VAVDAASARSADPKRQWLSEIGVELDVDRVYRDPLRPGGFLA